MTEYKVNISDQALKLKRMNVLRAYKYYQQAEPDTPEEAECEERLRKAIDDLRPWDKEIFDKCTMVEELDFWIRNELNLVGKEIN